LVFGTDEGIDGNPGQVRGPSVKIGCHGFRPFPADAAHDRRNGREVSRIMPGEE
jgi:hypothetical protein